MALYLRDKNGELKELTVTAASSTSAAKVTYKDGTVDDELTQLNKAISDHINSTANPHKVTKEQIGLANIVNTADSSVPVKDGLTKFTTGGAFTELGKKLDNSAAESTYLKKTDASSTYATLSTAQTFSAKKTFSGGINVPTKAPSNPQEGDIWIE